MSDQLKIKVTRRTDFGKGAARQARRAGLLEQGRTVERVLGRVRGRLRRVDVLHRDGVAGAQPVEQDVVERPADAAAAPEALEAIARADWLAHSRARSSDLPITMLDADRFSRMRAPAMA